MTTIQTQIGPVSLEGAGIPEIQDDPEVIESMVRRAITYLRGSKNVLFFTGAGISTAAGIPDLRGPNGILAHEIQGLKIPKKMETVSIPTFTHMAIKALQEHGISKFLISTNIDGLHLQSGFPEKKLIELHGNAFVEKCKLCKNKIVRDFPCRIPNQNLNEHGTFRSCPKCQSKVSCYDTIVNLGDNIPIDDFYEAETYAKQADCVFVFGSTLRTSPSCLFPFMGKKTNKNHKIVLINLQETPYDKQCDIVIHCKTDVFLAEICSKMGVTPSDYIYTKDLEIIFKKSKKTAFPSKLGGLMYVNKNTSAPVDKIIVRSTKPDGSVLRDIKRCSLNFVDDFQKRKKWHSNFSFSQSCKKNRFFVKNLGIALTNANYATSEIEADSMLPKSPKNKIDQIFPSSKSPFATGPPIWTNFDISIEFFFTPIHGTESNKINYTIPVKKIFSELINSVGCTSPTSPKSSHLKAKMAKSEAIFRFQFRSNCTTGYVEFVPL